MGMVFTVGGVVFGALASVNGRYALAEVTGAGIYDIIRYHVKGVDGSYLTRGGLIGYKVTCRMRYISNTPYADAAADKAAWENVAVPIATFSGQTYNRCTLDPDAHKVTRQSIAMGRGSPGQQFLDIEAIFTSDGLRT